jgi:hypothetical protein
MRRARSNSANRFSSSRTPRRVFDVQHLVKQNIFDCALRNARTIHSPIQQDLLRARIVAPELPPPASPAPGNVRPLQLPSEIPSI